MSATQKTIFYVTNEAETFGRTIPKNSVIYCRENKSLWENTVKCQASDSLTTLLSKVQLTVPAGTNALSDFKESVYSVWDDSINSLPPHETGKRYLATTSGNGWTKDRIYESRFNAHTNTDEWVEDPTSYGSIVLVENTGTLQIKNSFGVFVYFGTFVDKRPDIQEIEATIDGQTVITTTITLSATLEVCVDGIETRQFSRDNANQITLDFGISEGSKCLIKSFK